MDIKNKSTEQLKQLKESMAAEIKLREEGETLPVYVIYEAGTNSCFKVESEAMAFLNEDQVAFNEHTTTRCFIRDVPVSDYNLLSNDWIEV